MRPWTEVYMFKIMPERIGFNGATALRPWTAH